LSPGLTARSITIRPLVVRNFDAWYRAFDVRDGKLYLLPEQRIRIW
jgi:putative endopeptidase